MQTPECFANIVTCCSFLFACEVISTIPTFGYQYLIFYYLHKTARCPPFLLETPHIYCGVCQSQQVVLASSQYCTVLYRVLTVTCLLPPLLSPPQRSVSTFRRASRDTDSGVRSIRYSGLFREILRGESRSYVLSSMVSDFNHFCHAISFAKSNLFEFVKSMSIF